jgi:hypothetical protein
LFFVPGGVIDAIDDAMLARFAAENGVTDLSAFPGTTPVRGYRRPRLGARPGRAPGWHHPPETVVAEQGGQRPR